MAAYRIEHYLTSGEQQDLYVEWLQQLRLSADVRIAVVRRVARIEQGDFGEHQLCRKGVWEMLIGIGEGYRVYYGVADHRIVLIQGGGGNRTHRAEVDLSVAYWQDWRRRTDDEK